ncbi:MAG: 16S rRNA (guanine(966)-N(2))-methyltransferase RsmD [Phototrophicales bacterium]|nr:MAG: 16S rRNA (guanine(966)-N(2))-methyltransferase RsmD [Phototrophicales bacterium]
MSHRVIAGIAKGRRLKLVPGNTTRPIMDRVKESLFNILSGDIPESRFLDLFAGTGAVGIEALSRGAAYVRFLDKDKTAIRTIQDNLRHTHLEENAEVIQTDSLRYLQRRRAPSFDIVYIAPPQYQGMWKEALMLLDENPVHLNPDAIVVVQIHPKEFEDVTLHNLTEFDRRKYGKTLLIFYEYVTPEDRAAEAES